MSGFEVFPTSLVNFSRKKKKKSNTHTHKVLFIIGDWNTKVRSQQIPVVTGKFGLGVQNEAGQRLKRVLPRELTGHSKCPLSTIQEMTKNVDITRWSTTKSDSLNFL